MRSNGPAKSVEEGRAREVDPVSKAMPVGVSSGDGERVFGDVGRHERCTGPFKGEADREAPAARAGIRDSRRRRGVAQKRQRGFDDQLALRAGDEDGRRHLEVEPPELAVSRDVGHRHAPLALHERGFES